MSLCLASASYGQGLLSLGQDDDFDSELPFTVTLATGVGYDSNSGVNSLTENDSVYYQAGVSVAYSSALSDQTRVRVGGHFSTIHYADQAPGLEDTYYNSRVTLDFSHAVSPRLKIGNNFYLSYEIEPDYQVGASTVRRTDQYLYGYNNFSVAYAWSQRLSSVTNYIVSGVSYDDGAFDLNDRLSHTFGHQFKYALNRRTAATAEYRFSFTNFDQSAFGDTDSHYFLAGVDHSFSPQLAGSIRAGAQLIDYDRGGDRTRPYVEGALNYRAGEDTSFRAYTRLGIENSELLGYEDRYSWRTGLSANHMLTARLSAHGGIHYVHNEFEESIFGLADFSEDLVALNIGLGYQILTNVSLTADYSFVNISSDVPSREYDRNRVSVGLQATF